MELRDYQKDAVESAWKSARQGKNSVLVLPTGAGKSIILAQLCRDAISWGARAIVLAHRKELLEQNAEKIDWLGCPVGIYSAGLNKRDTEQDIIVGGIQSVYRKATKFGRRQLLIVDECHRINAKDEDSQYSRFVRKLKECNPDLIVVGLSATPFRTGEGEITDGGLFDEIAYEARIDELIKQGYLCPVVNRTATNAVSMAGVSVRGGEFVQRQMEDAFLSDVDDVCHETVVRCRGQQSIVVFCSGVAHAERVQELIQQETGEEVGLITGDTLPLVREGYLRQFKAGNLRWLININVLTEGFDSPRIDTVVMMRATCSPGLFAQAVGRGFRVHESKSRTKVIDFGGNIDRHGPLDSPEFGRNSKKGDGGGDAPVKTCEQCGRENLIAAKECECGFLFPEQESRLGEADEKSPILLGEAVEHQVISTHYYLHTKRDDPESRTLRVDYRLAGLDRISEWVCIEHIGYARQKACEWWMIHSNTETPLSVDEALDLADAGALRKPDSIVAKKDGKYWRIVSRSFDCEKPANWKGINTEEIPF